MFAAIDYRRYSPPIQRRRTQMDASMSAREGTHLAPMVRDLVQGGIIAMSAADSGQTNRAH